MSGVVRGDARSVPLADASVDLVVTSPPYFAQRSYKDDGEHYDGQVGAEPRPGEFLEALWCVMADVWRVLRPTGSVFVNLGDKRSGSGAPGTTSGLNGGAGPVQGDRAGMTKLRRTDGDAWDRSEGGGLSRQVRAYNREAYGRPKSRQALPERFVIGCEDGRADPDGIGWIYRQDLIWEKPNGLPESVKDRTRDNFEHWYHLVKQGDYYSAVDELRDAGPDDTALGSLPGSVWRVATEPLVLPGWLGVDHFAAFPTEWPRRLILGWSPPAVCLECGRGRFPVVRPTAWWAAFKAEHGLGDYTAMPDGERGALAGDGVKLARTGVAIPSGPKSEIVGHACDCTPRTVHPDRAVPRQEAGVNGDGTRATGGTRLDPALDWPERLPRVEYELDGWTAPPSRPAVVLDPFGGTGTTALVARALNRVGVSLDLSLDYCRVARWRVYESGHGARVRSRYDRELQGVLL